MKFLERLKICGDLYGGNVRKVGKIFIHDNRRHFYIYYENSIPKYQKQIIYADYKIEKKFSYKKVV
jgi:hypothetical protein